MSSSIQTVFHDAVAALRRNGEEQIASALERLLADPRLRQLQACRTSEAAALADAVFACGSLEALHALLPRVASALGVAHCTIHCVRERGANLYRTRVLTTYPYEWAAEYVGRRYSMIDPIMLRCQAGPGTFFWSEPCGEDPAARTFLAAAAAYGVGPAGITFVSDTADGNAVAVSLASTGEHAAFRRAFTPRVADFNGIAALMAEVFAELAGRHDRPGSGVTAAQLERLRALVLGRSLQGRHDGEAGASASAEALILQGFGAGTLAEAAALARTSGLLDDLPYLQEDIFVPGR